MNRITQKKEVLHDALRNKIEHRLQDIKEELPKYWVLNRVMVVMLVVFLIFEVALHLNNEGILTFPQEVIMIAAGAVLVMLSLLIASAFIRLTENWLFALIFRGAEIEQTLFFKKLYGLGVYFFAIAFILFKFGVSIANITLFAGLVASGVAFAIRDVLLSYLIWFILLTKKPFRIGDYIKIGDESGKVLHIGTFYVIVDHDEEVDSEIVRIPNKVFLEKPLQNFGSEGIFMDVTRVPFKGMPKDIDKRVKKAQQILKTLVSGRTYVDIDATNEWVYLLLRYPVRYSERELFRTKLFLALGREAGKEQEIK